MTREEYGGIFLEHRRYPIKFLTARYGLSLEDAEDIAQTAWCNGWRKIDRLENPSQIMTWIIQICVNELRSEKRKPHKYVPLKEDMAVPPKVNLAAIDAINLLRKMSSADREALIAQYLKGKSMEEIAEEEGISIGSAKSRALRSRNKALGCIEQDNRKLEFSKRRQERQAYLQ